MEYLLYLIVINSLGTSISTNVSTFNSESTCLQAISKLIDMEKNGIKIKARCIRK
jgi:hypothetical protein